ncbi:MAG: YraN family protein [Chitinophagaceae bacterium]|jgi:putative endonuclease|nr:YraN family protein [Chitinophagaceae bacterium]
MHNQNIGKGGENLAVAFLIEKGFEIITINWRYKRCEVDVIAAKNNHLHFIEVKTRTSHKYGNPEESVTKKKMNNLKIAAEEFQHLHPEWKYLQFDVLAITIEKNKQPEYFFNEDVYF